MPNFDGGHYFLTALIPIRTDVLSDDAASTSPVHALRKRLAMLPTAAQTAACSTSRSPFARNTSTHFVRFTIIDTMAYNGRENRNALVVSASGENPVVAQKQDHLSCPFLLFVVDFDARNGKDSERDSYLADLWNKMGAELRDLFRFCRAFDERVKDAASFAKYIGDCQIETTMSFNDYYIDPLDLPVWPVDPFKWGGIASAGLLALGLLGVVAIVVLSLFTPVWPGALHGFALLALLGGAALAIVVAAAYASVTAAGAKPFPAAPDSSLPIVLKSLYLQKIFTRFAIDGQMLAATRTPEADKELYDRFAAFLQTHRPNDSDKPTQAAGVIGI
jgi:hypothetical protein